VDLQGKYAPLTMAAQYGHTDVVSMLIKAGADLDAREPQVHCVLCVYEVVMWTELT
jgi:ankyrin repeat protein